MKINNLILLSILLTLVSCKGQNDPGIITGEVVPQLSESILIVFQASNGDYWFGSDVDGAYKFNGENLIHFSTKDGLSHDRIRSIREDKRGNIYFATLGGISKFDGKNFSTLQAIKSNSAADNWKLQPDDLWFSMAGKSGDNGPYRYDGENLYELEFPEHYLANEYFTENPDRTWSPYEVYSIYKDKSGTMWFGTGAFGVCRYDGVSLTWLYEEHLTRIEGGGSFGIRSILEDKDGKFWFCNTSYKYDILPKESKSQDEHLISYEREKGIENLLAPDGKDMIYFMSALEDNNGDMWMVTYNQGVWRYDGKNVTHYSVKNGNEDVTLFSIYKDQKGELWLGTHDDGAYKFNGKEFKKFKI